MKSSWYLLGLILIFLIIIAIILALALVISRECSPREIDDVHHKIPCKQDLLDDATWLWVIPLYDNVPISEDKEYCQKLISSGKKLGMHGVKHTLAEFAQDVTPEYLEAGIVAFEAAFGYKPTHFKPPKIMITAKNAELVRAKGMTLHNRFQQLIHKVYHCEDHGRHNQGRLEHETEETK
jgi:hypothetical protein